MRRLSGEDNSFLAWESAVQPQHTIKAVVLDPAQGHEPLTFGAVRAALPGLVDRVEPLQWQLMSPRVGAGRPWWITRARGDLNYHLRRATAAAPGTDRELGAAIAELLEEPLERDRPAWQLWYLDGLADGRVALVLKIHHAVADGMASLNLLEQFYSADPADRLPEPSANPVPDEHRPPSARWFPMVARQQLKSLRRLPNVVARTAKVTGTIRRRQKAGKPGYAEAFVPPALPFNDPLTAKRGFAFRSCDMAQIKHVSKAFGVSVNDVFLAMCSTVLREYQAARGPVGDDTMTAVVPVSMRPQDGDRWGNKVARWNVELATHIADPVDRLRAIAAATATAREVQSERDAWLQHDWMEYWPLFKFYSRALPIIGAQLKKRPMFSMIASNMRGPQQRLYFGGAPVEKLISTGPLVFPMGMNITGWSYEGDLQICVLTCTDQVDDPHGIADRLPAALAELVARCAAAADCHPARRL
ncbi:MAG: wax ester/triacylglycerol synthase family O-acyltransferase [Mycobacterium sp.]|nr:wax ester/triacylglycerol synthase family O-acyltransferase [Mycobacterium sp.]